MCCRRINKRCNSLAAIPRTACSYISSGSTHNELGAVDAVLLAVGCSVRCWCHSPRLPRDNALDVIWRWWGTLLLPARCGWCVAPGRCRANTPRPTPSVDQYPLAHIACQSSTTQQNVNKPAPTGQSFTPCPRCYSSSTNRCLVPHGRTPALQTSECRQQTRRTFLVHRVLHLRHRHRLQRSSSTHSTLLHCSATSLLSPPYSDLNSSPDVVRSRCALTEGHKCLGRHVWPPGNKRQHNIIATRRAPDHKTRLDGAAPARVLVPLIVVGRSSVSHRPCWRRVACRLAHVRGYKHGRRHKTQGA